jgi:hypothetical protein
MFCFALQLSSVSHLDSPSDYEHMALLYNSHNNRDYAVARYLNTGLMRGQLCVYATISYRDKGHLDRISALITDYEKNVQKGNLAIVDLAPMYIAAMCGNLEPFKQACEQLARMAESREDKHIRFFGDCVGFLFHNRHFEECLALESIGQNRPFLGSYLCGYEKSIMSNPIHSNYKRSILEVKHDTVVDAEEMQPNDK